LGFFTDTFSPSNVISLAADFFLGNCTGLAELGEAVLFFVFLHDVFFYAINTPILTLEIFPFQAKLKRGFTIRNIKKLSVQIFQEKIIQMVYNSVVV
jgi:hypothetical protein